MCKAGALRKKWREAENSGGGGPHHSLIPGYFKKFSGGQWLVRGCPRVAFCQSEIYFGSGTVVLVRVRWCCAACGMI